MDTATEDINSKKLNNEDKLILAMKFLTAMQKQDWEIIPTLLTPDSFWEMPGDNILSGRSLGQSGVIAKARLITSFGLNIQLNHILYGDKDMAISLHNQANRDGKILDEYLVSFCLIEDGKVAGITTYLSDIQMMDAFFGKETE
jgi:ketosteroid isomerase-like protein